MASKTVTRSIMTLYFSVFTYRVNKEGFTPVNAACLNKNLECLGLLVQHGGSLGKVSTLQTESAIESAQLTHHKKLIKFVSHLTNKDLTDDGRDLLESTDEDGQKVIFFNLRHLNLA